MWRQLDMEDYEAVVALRDVVLNNLADPDMYVREDDEEMFVRGHLNMFGESLGFFDGDDLVAYLALTTDLVAARKHHDEGRAGLARSDRCRAWGS